MRTLAGLLVAVFATLFWLETAIAQGRPKGRPATAAPAAEPVTPQVLLKWINGFRERPEPNRLPEAVKAMSALGLFKDQDQNGVYIGFIAGVLKANPDAAERLVREMFPIPPDDQVAIIRAIAYSGLDGWKGLLSRFIERMPARRVLIQHHLYGKGATFATLDLKAGPSHLDIMWGHYFGSGQYAAVDRILAILPWAGDRNDVEKLTIGSMAKWTLANNLQQDHRLLVYVKRKQGELEKAAARHLAEVVTAAETFETGAIRKQAMAAIEELRRKGPEAARNTVWWGQAGQTALALGCIVASAVGFPEVGIPCIIGGAISQAALKYLVPPQ